jgi:hypothetical protein
MKMTNFTRKLFAIMFAAGAFSAAVAASGIAPADAAPMVRDHRAQPVVRDHRSSGPVVRDHRDGGRNGGRGGGVVVTSSPRDRGCSVARCPSRPRDPLKCVMRNGRYKCS